MQEIGLLAHYKILVILLLVNSLIFPQSHPEPKIDKLLKEGISEIIKQNYRNAEKIFLTLDEEFNEIPLGKIYIAATLIAEGYDYEIPFDNNRINLLLTQAKKISDDLLSKDSKNIWNKYYRALLDGYAAYFEAIKGNLLNAFSIGLTSFNLFDEILIQDSSFQDAKIAVGTYKYWRSDKLEFLNWLPFVHDEKELGIKYLQSSIKNNSYNSHLAIYSLIWIYIHKKEFVKAKNLTEFALKKYPQSRIFKEALARVYEDIDLEQSVLLYSQLLNSYEKLKLENRVKVLILKHKIAIQLQKLGKNKQALEICEEILAEQNFTKFEMEKLGARLERVKNLASQLKK